MTPKPAGKKTSGPILPEEHFWQCYSSRGELPLSVVASITLHALPFGLVLLLAVLGSFLIQQDRQRPVRMDVIGVPNAAALFGGGGSGSPGGPTARTDRERTEDVQPAQQPVRPRPSKDKKFELQDPDQKPLEVPNPDLPGAQVAADVFDEVLDDAREEVARAMAAARANANTANPGDAPTPGDGGSGGPGGAGSPGGGGGGSDTERREQRWAINFSGAPQEHLAKLKALRVTLALPTPSPTLFQIVDLSGPQVRFRPDNLANYQNRVKCWNTNSGSMVKLAQALGLKQVPRYAVIFIPPEMEEELVRLETGFRGLAEQQIDATYFEVRQGPGGRYAPAVVRQEKK